MRTLRLLGAAAEAEGIRLRRTATLAVRGVVLLLGAGIAGIVATGFLHAAGWIWLAREYSALTAALVLAAVDGMAMLLLAWMARRRPDPVADEALLMRRRLLAAAAREAPVGLALGLFGLRWPLRSLVGRLARLRPGR